MIRKPDNYGPEKAGGYSPPAACRECPRKPVPGSPLGWSITGRVLGAAVASALLWLAVAWALGWLA